jgi:hypothetical protein
VRIYLPPDEARDHGRGQERYAHQYSGAAGFWATEVPAWPMRQDPFSLFRSTFDVRTYPLCRRILMFDEFGVSRDLYKLPGPSDDRTSD